MADTTIPKKLYVTVQYRRDANNESGLLGFASPYTKDSAFYKRKSTQDSWAYGYSTKVNIDESDDTITLEAGTAQTRGGLGGGEKWDATMLFIANCHPRILENEPIEGFEIAKSVRRYGWNGGGNVKWRISDPRGFDLEVSSENFASIIDCSTIVNGVIQGKCVWGRNGKDNILLPEVSEPYKEAFKQTIKVNTKVSLKDIQVGDYVELLSSKLYKEDCDRSQYLGKYFFLEVQEGSDEETRYRYRYGNGKYSFTKVVERYMFKSEKGYFTLGTPKVTAILEKIATPLNKNDVAKEVTGLLSKDVTVRDTNDLILISDTKIDPKTITTVLSPCNEQFGETWPKSGYYVKPIVCKIDGGYWLATNSNHSYNQSPTTDVMSVDMANLAQNTFSIKYSIAYSRTYGRNQHEDIRQTVKPNLMEKYYMVVTANGISGTVTRI